MEFLIQVLFGSGDPANAIEILKTHGRVTWSKTSFDIGTQKYFDIKSTGYTGPTGMTCPAGSTGPGYYIPISVPRTVAPWISVHIGLKVNREDLWNQVVQFLDSHKGRQVDIEYGQYHHFETLEKMQPKPEYEEEVSRLTALQAEKTAKYDSLMQQLNELGVNMDNDDYGPSCPEVPIPDEYYNWETTYDYSAKYAVVKCQNGTVIYDVLLESGLVKP